MEPLKVAYCLEIFKSAERQVTVLCMTLIVHYCHNYGCKGKSPSEPPHILESKSVYEHQNSNCTTVEFHIKVQIMSY